jgi:hypothetical protein
LSRQHLGPCHRGGFIRRLVSMIIDHHGDVHGFWGVIEVDKHWNSQSPPTEHTRMTYPDIEFHGGSFVRSIGHLG